MFELSPQAAAVTDVRGKILWKNKKTRKLNNGFCRAESDRLEDILFLDAAETEKLKLLLSDNSSSDEKKGTFKSDINGTGYKIDIVLLPFRDYSGRKRFLCSFDQTEESADTDEMYFSMTSIDSFYRVTGEIAHNCKNFFWSVSVHAELLREELEKTDCSSETLEKIFLSAKEGMRYASEISSVIRPQKLSREMIDISDLLERRVTFYQNGKRSSLKIDFNNCCRKIYISGNQSAIENAFDNVFKNAVESISDSGRIMISCSEICIEKEFSEKHPLHPSPGQYAEVSVADTGSGISQEHLKRIFEPFFTTKVQSGGTGLGLPITFRIVHDHGGFMSVSSRQETGSVFKVYLPLMIKQALECLKKEPVTNGKTILLIDDESLILHLIRKILAAAGYSVIAFECARTAIEEFRKDPDRYDMVIVDYVMPELSGKEVFQQIRCISSKKKIMLISGFIVEEDLQKLYAEGLNAFIQKPFGEDLLLDSVKRILSLV